MSTPSNTTQRLIAMLIDRDAAGQAKYRQTLDRTDLLCEDWARHAEEEALDLAGYLVRVAQTAAELRAENSRLTEENLRLRSMLQPILELAKTLDTQPPAPVKLPETAGIKEAVPVKRDAVGLTAREIAETTGFHKDTVNNWVKAGLLPDPVSGTGGHPRNPPRYVVDIDNLLERVKARQESAKSGMSGKSRKPVSPDHVSLVREAQKRGWDEIMVGFNRQTMGICTQERGPFPKDYVLAASVSKNGIVRVPCTAQGDAKRIGEELKDALMGERNKGDEAR